LPLSSTQNLSTIDCGLAPNFGLCERHSRFEFCPTHIPLVHAGLLLSSSYTLAVCRATRSACRSNRRMYFVRDKRSTGISHYRFAMLIGENLDERKMVYATKESAVSVYQACATWSREHHRPRFCYRQIKGLLGAFYCEESPPASASCERFLEHQSYSFRFAQGWI
jgi:hypothetical protein